MTDLLKEYSKEIFGPGHEDDLSLKDLIDSHRHLRQLNLETNETRLQAREEGYNIGIKQGLEQINSEYIKIADLKNMTLGQITQLLEE